jgi:hypothetical protein
MIEVICQSNYPDFAMGFAMDIDRRATAIAQMHCAGNNGAGEWNGLLRCLSRPGSFFEAGVTVPTGRFVDCLLPVTVGARGSTYPGCARRMPSQRGNAFPQGISTGRFEQGFTYTLPSLP